MRGKSVHPRVCGERTCPDCGHVETHGSSPRVRGTVHGIDPVVSGQRFIPACAGNGERQESIDLCLTVHPRVCGERPCCRLPAVLPVGSSPRVRGTESSIYPDLRFPRFIPACAGNGTLPVIPAAVETVHPRVCGERRTAGKHRPLPDGSSPRVRGTACPSRLGAAARRFIPACAGNGPAPVRCTVSQTVHPRVCGERRTAGKHRPLPDGSSPRVRGTACPSRLGAAARRFIPACAGNGPAPVRCTVSQTVHPRVCGERSSERTTKRRDPRFIPACAGNGFKTA